MDDESWEGSAPSRADRFLEPVRRLGLPSWAPDPRRVVAAAVVFAVGVLVGAALLGDVGETSCREVFERAQPARNELARTFGQGEEGRDAVRELLEVVRARPDCFRPEEVELFERQAEESATEPPLDAPTAVARTEDSLTVSFEDDVGDVFATGETERGVRWVAAARRGEPPCVGVRIEARRGKDSAVSCSPRTPTPIQAVRTANEVMSVVAVAGWVSDDVSRIVWELPDGPQAVTIHALDRLPSRVFAAAGPLPGTVTMLVAYDSTGQPLGGLGIAGAPSDPEAQEQGEPEGS